MSNGSNDNTFSTTQETLFQRIREKLPVTASFVDVIAEKLFISNDSAYRRIRGETPLVIEEAKILCEAFNISLDNLLRDHPKAISFIPVHIQQSEQTFESYLRNILQRLKNLASHNASIVYLTKDLPLFYDMALRPLFAFHYFFWMKSILQHPAYREKQFDGEFLPEDVERAGTEILEHYCQIPSTEIWNTECINSTIAQIEYYREAGYFSSNAYVQVLYDALEKLIEHIQLQAESGCKFMPGQRPDLRQSNYTFFYNRLVLGSNTILVSAGGKRAVYLNYDVLDFLTTQNEFFCNQVTLNLERLMKKSTLLSQVSDKQRKIFFNILLKKIPDRKIISP